MPRAKQAETLVFRRDHARRWTAREDNAKFILVLEDRKLPKAEERFWTKWTWTWKVFHLDPYGANTPIAERPGEGERLPHQVPFGWAQEKVRKWKKAL